MSVNFRFIKLLWVTDNMVNPQSGRQKISTSLTEKNKSDNKLDMLLGIWKDQANMFSKWASALGKDLCQDLRAFEVLWLEFSPIQTLAKKPAVLHVPIAHEPELLIWHQKPFTENTGINYRHWYNILW